MATIFFRRVRNCSPSYLSIIAVKDIGKGDSLLAAQEYRIVCGDIGASIGQRRDALRKLRAEMRKDGHRLVTVA